jgi:Mrp family chromosome partitioning ATPase
MDYTSPLAAIRQRWWLVVGMALIGALIGAFPQPERVDEQATEYTATHTMLANDTGDATTVSPSQVTLLATAGEVPARVARSIAYEGNSAELASQVEVVFDFESGALTVSTTQDSPERAELIANGFADELNAYLTERQDAEYAERVAAARERLEGLEADLADLVPALAQSPDDPILGAEQEAISRQYALAYEQNRELESSQDRLTLTTLERAQAIAEVDRGLSAPTSRLTRGAMGGVVGAVLGLLAAVVIGRLDTKIRSREQAEDLVGMRARVVIPKLPAAEHGVVVRPNRQDPLSDGYRTVRNVVGFVQSGLRPSDKRSARITLVVSAGPGDGKTSMTANLAAAFVETGQRTIAVNTDFRRPRLYEAVMHAPQPESPFELHELDDIPRQALPVAVSDDNLRVLDFSNVFGSPGELVRASMRQIDRLASSADEIVIDTSPVGATAEVLDLVPYADVIVLVVRVGHTSIHAVERTIAILRDIATAPILLVIGGVKIKLKPYHEYTDRRPKQNNGDDDATPAGGTEPLSLQATE